MNEVTNNPAPFEDSLSPSFDLKTEKEPVIDDNDTCGDCGVPCGDCGLENEEFIKAQENLLERFTEQSRVLQIEIDSNIRLKALSIAVQVKQNDTNDEVIQAAEKFVAFIKGAE